MCSSYSSFQRHSANMISYSSPHFVYNLWTTPSFIHHTKETFWNTFLFIYFFHTETETVLVNNPHHSGRLFFIKAVSYTRTIKISKTKRLKFVESLGVWDLGTWITLDNLYGAILCFLFFSLLFFTF